MPIVKQTSFIFPETVSSAIRRYSPTFKVTCDKNNCCPEYYSSSESQQTSSKINVTPPNSSLLDGLQTTSPVAGVSSPVLSDEDFLTPSPDIPDGRKLENLFDPYQIFEVEHRPCLVLEVTVLCGRNITNGWRDYVDTPDPYIYLCIPTAPEGRQKTSVKDNDVNPKWNESFTFLLDEAVQNIMEIRLMESNIMHDEVVGVQVFNIQDLKRDVQEKKTFVFNKVSEVDIEMKLQLDKEPTLRHSLCLCDQEKAFLQQRKQKVMEGMASILPADKASKNIYETPTIAVIGSGGGFRAMVGLSGVVQALHDSGILQCTTYLCGLSGSSWYISTLYAHPNWPHMSPADMHDELKKNIDSNFLWLLNPKGVYRYMDQMLTKRRNGQPISFTDFFGYLVGETLLRGNSVHSRLTDQQAKIADGKVPMPLMTCVHVKKDVSERQFQEWVEFTPYEIGMAKYGTFLPTELFGSKFFMGKLCKKYLEPPLHYLQGIWGSAFCILFRRLFEDNRRLDPVEMIRQEMAKQLEENEKDESSDSSEDGEFNDDDDNNLQTVENDSAINCSHKCGTSSKYSSLLSKEKDNVYHLKNKCESPGGVQTNPRLPLKRTISTRRTKQKSYWSNILKGVFENKNFALLNTRAGRAGLIHNFMRGLSISKIYPISPFSPVRSAMDDVDSIVKDSNSQDNFGEIFEMHPTNVKHLYMVDAGLTFNSPFPVVLRPQREVDIILSFDFSARPSDSSPPFIELLLAAEWAKKHHLLFPPIDTTVFDRDGMKELYIFRDPNNQHCPIVFHFCLVNLEFRRFSKPGVPRRTKEDKAFGNFEIFDDPATLYSTFNFQYTHLAFERLSKLMEFNTLLNIDEIKKVIMEVIERKRAVPSRFPCTLSDVPKLHRVTQKNKLRLARFLSRLQSGYYSTNDAKKDIDNVNTDIALLDGESSPEFVDAPSSPLLEDSLPVCVSPSSVAKQIKGQPAHSRTYPVSFATSPPAKDISQCGLTA